MRNYDSTRFSSSRRPQPPSPLELIREEKARRLLSKIAQRPAMILEAAGIEPDPWQADFLTSRSTRLNLLCCRRAGKSTATAALVLCRALTRPRPPTEPILIFSPTERQSEDLLRKVKFLDLAIGCPVPTIAASNSAIEYANGSRIISMPDSPRGVVGFSPPLIVIDEAAKVSDELYLSIRPMLFDGSGLILLSTAYGQRGFFFDIWNDKDGRLKVFEHRRITAYECPRMTPEFLAEERIEMGDRWFRQEYECRFEAGCDAVFSPEAIARAMSDEVEPLFG